MKNLQRYIEHTNLKTTVDAYAIEQLTAEAVEHQFKGICVPPFWVKKVRRDLGESDVQLVTVAGFPLGYHMTETKVEEIKVALRDGADEIDLVMNISALKAQMPWVKVEFAKCAKLVHEQERILKVIIETAYLNEQELELACRWCADAGVDFVKTSTGFAPEGAKVEVIRRMREILPSNVGIKASGGIKSYEQAVALIEAGADRIGTSSGTEIMKQAEL
ncbi:deoxyribose-phosphate aldolase [Nafulsella turpanensis]|uniref:deoxyribose-phosphate aldolase n=1 Tax=Nafulsella turpanensis TaxID=1265690 RepID=UPI00034C0B67|nr:deoxyribose-phosphate aldolase [Nafulsella turpanensis]